MSQYVTVTKEEAVLAALAASNGATHTPVQVQKLLFLIDKKIPNHVGGPHFKFSPYDYGPFDPRIYSCLDTLAQKGFIEVLSQPELRWKQYRTTSLGLERGHQLLASIKPQIREYLQQLSEFVRRLTFAELVASIYREYPEMKVNSVFRSAA